MSTSQFAHVRVIGKDKEMTDAASQTVAPFAVAVLLISGLADIVGNLHLGAIVTVAYVLWCWLPLRTRLRELRPLWSLLYPFFIFLAWAVLSFAWQRPFASGLENLAVLLAFLGLILQNSGKMRSSSNLRLSSALAISVWGSATLYAISLVAEGPGASNIIGARIFGLVALIGISWYISRWYSGLPKSLGLAAVLVLLVSLSLSRMAFAIGIALFAFASITAAEKGKRLRYITVTVLFTVVTLAAMSRFTSFTDRIENEEGTTSALNVGSVELDTSGRLVMWALVWESYLDSPWIGKGAGSSADLVQSRLTDIDHPHCDYLMLLHDYGLVGLMLFLLGLLNLFQGLRKEWRASKVDHRGSATLCLATIFLFIAIMIAMFTDNCLSYIFLIAPLAVMIGVSLRPRTSAMDILPQQLPERI